jgi:Zn-finger nucleic acid-binding protein
MLAAHWKEPTMKCPACFNSLTETTVGKLTVDVCQGGCGGIWFDAFELQRVDEPGEIAGERLIDIERDPALHVHSTHKRDCPRCSGVKLKRRFFSPMRQVEIDECPGCGGCWLDSGELQLIRREVAESAERQALPQQLSITTIRYLYQLRLQMAKDDEA